LAQVSHARGLHTRLAPRGDFGDYFQQQFSDAAMDYVKGQVTGKKYIDDDVNIITTEVYFYDSHYRVVQGNKFLDNPQKEVFCTGNLYSFGGAVLKTNYKFYSQDVDTLTYAFRFFYDHDWRNTGYAIITGSDSIPLVEQDYSETGNLISKHFDPRNNSPLYTMDYRYNPRGWLTSINELTNNFDDMIFGLKLFYEAPPQDVPGIAPPQYNGNISAMKWFTKFEEHTPYINAYGFSYDNINRLKSANFYHIQKDGTVDFYPVDTTSTGPNSGYPSGIASVDNITYDKNGNIKSLFRSFRKDNTGIVFDKLKYFYEGNRLIAVDDDIEGQNNMGDFTDNGHKYTIFNLPEFRYDKNGNMTEDINRGIKVEYTRENNLPKTISFNDGYIENQYFYTGTKYAKREFDAGGNLLNDEKYFDNLVLKNGNPFRILHGEGYVDLSNGLAGGLYFHVKDHLGNVRAVLGETPDRRPYIVQASGYYPFGMFFQSERMQSTQDETANPYLYNGKEIQKMPGRWYDYGARMYDAGLGRWFVVDPLCEWHFNFTNYNYCFNNPVKYIDPFGLDTLNVNDDKPVKKDDVVVLDDGSLVRSNSDETEIKDNRPGWLRRILAALGRFFSNMNTEGNGGTQQSGIHGVTRGKEVSPTKYKANYSVETVNIDLLLAINPGAGRFRSSSLDFANATMKAFSINKILSDKEIVETHTGLGEKTDANGQPMGKYKNWIRLDNDSNGKYFKSPNGDTTLNITPNGDSILFIGFDGWQGHQRYMDTIYKVK